MRKFIAALALAGCAFALGQTVVEIADPAVRIEEDAQTKLQAAYHKLVASISADRHRADKELVLKRLAEAQQSWIAYRDAQVSFVAIHADIGSASSRRLGAAAYSRELTELRIKDLQAIPNPY